MGVELLTDHALEKFLVYVYYNEDTNQALNEKNKDSLIFHAQKWLERQDVRLIRSLIVDWFDIQGFYIGVETEEIFEHTAFYYYVNESNLDETFGNRSVGLIAAITKGNELFNERENNLGNSQR